MKAIFRLCLILSIILTVCTNVSCLNIPRVKVTFRFTNQDGEPAIGVPISFGLATNYAVRGETDENGFFVGEGYAHDKYLLIAAYGVDGKPHEKYYRMSYEKQVADWENVPEDGKWKPWNEIVDFIIKEKKNPIPMYHCRLWDFKYHVPMLNEWLGYDFEYNDWIAPYGKGKVVDIECNLSFERYDEKNFRQILRLRFPYPQSGAYFMKKDKTSVFSSVYNADSNALYQNEITFIRDYTSRLSGVTRLDEESSFYLKKEDYLIFRTRTKVDKDGNLVEALYGKIYGPIEFKVWDTKNTEENRQRLQMQYYLNPNVNDTNLECGEIIKR